MADTGEMVNVSVLCTKDTCDLFVNESEKYGITTDELANKSIELMRRQMSGYGEAEITFAVGDTFVIDLIEEEIVGGRSVSDAINVALDENRILFERKEEYPDDVNINFILQSRQLNGKGLRYEERAQKAIDVVAGRASMQEDSVPVDLNLTKDAANYLIWQSYKRCVMPGKILEDAIAMAADTSGYLGDDGNIGEYKVQISAANMEYLRKEATNHSCYERTIYEVYYTYRQRHAEEKKEKKIPLTKAEKELDDIGWN